ncbi:hypothetical protein WA026_011509 [Henosepilachna vigintioctopunctata]|uniref:Microtubule-associated protein futsch n=1 Tax=Henosepilachna vigintioctopunctata TaxID=420089 RepID=A0AAW1TS05_9CUCU
MKEFERKYAQSSGMPLWPFVSGLLSWNVNDCLVDLEKELSIVTEQGLEGEEARYGERLIQYASENLVTEILIHPSVSTLAQCVRNLLSSFTRHRHIIHAGYTFAANGSWVLQDGTFSLADFSEAFQEVDVQRVIHAYENGISIDIHCSAEGDWTKLPKESFTKGCKLRINPDDVLGSGLPAVTNFVNYIAPFLIPAELEHTLESSDVVGNIRFSRPTLYVFPGGQGDAALFGINGFNMLVDGGFSRKACFWDFVRHLDRLDAVILTRLNNSNANGIGAVLRRKAQNAVYPQIGHFFCNIQSRKANLSPDGDKDSDPLLINLLEEGHELISNLRSLDLSPQLCYRDTEPINLYHKVGHGTLDMYVLNPAKDSREVKEFLLRWNNNDQKLFANHKFSREYMLPLQNIVSICALLVWRPANPNDTITRILFPGSAPQGKVIEGLDKLKNLECIKHTVCTERTLVPPSKLKSKENILDKIVPPEKSKLEAKKNKIKPTPENKIIENNMKNGLQNDHTERQVTKASSVESDKSETKSTKPKREEAKVADNKQEKVSAKPKADTNISKTKQKASDKKVSPPTPKKVIDTKKSEIDKDSNNQRARSKISPSATPAKSTKDANNRKVLESKTKSTAKKDTKETKQPEKREEIKKFERKPISRRPKNEMKLPQSPVKRVVNGVHKPDSLGRKGKLDKEGTTDSSTVSTPSVDQDSLMKKDISKLTPEEVQQLKAQELAELKEEQEAIKELEAVFRKGDKINIEESDLREIKDTSIEDKTEPEEYLIVEKETIEPTPSETEIKEEETVKLARDSEESEKRKDRDEGNDEKDKQVDTEQEESGIGEQETDIEDGDDIRDNVMSKEPSVLSPEENKRFISKEDELKESQPEEKISANIESGATTTAPTLPEDERIPLNEIKEDTGDQIEEKHVREETKEKETKEELPVITLTSKPKDNLGKVPTVVGIRLDKESRIRDIVKTPDEVADLPVHEEADVDHLEEYVLEGTEKTKLKDITLEIDSLVKHETSEEDERIDKQEHKDEQHERKPEKLHIHDDEEIESPENKGEIVKDDFESKHTPKESDKIVQEITEQKKPTTEIVAESIQEDQPLNDQAPEKEHKLVDKEKLDVKEMIIQPALDEEQVPKDVKADMKEKKGEIPTEDISTSSKKDKDVPEQKEVISSIIPISGEAIEKKTHVKSEIHEKESKGVEDATHDDDGSQIRSPPGKEKVVESEDLTKVEQDIISKETVADEEDRIHVEALDKLAQTPQKEEVAEKPQFKDTKTIPISSDVEEIYDDIESKIIPKEEKHTEQDISEEKIEKAVGSVKVDEEKIHEPLIEKHSPAASDKESPKLEKEEIAVVEKDKTENILDKAIKDTHLGVESVLDENQVGTTEEKEKNLLGDLMATKVDDKKEHIQEVLKEKHDSEIDAKQASPQKEVFITKMIPDEHSKKIEPIEDEIKNEVPAVASDKNDIGMNQQLTHDEELKAEYSSDETRVEQKLEVKTHVESADALSKEVELPKDNEVVIEHLDEKIELYEEQAVKVEQIAKPWLYP